MSERLSHLQRQQALLREHLAWIETEIARETGLTPSPLPPSVSAASTQLLSPTLPASSLPAVATSAPHAPEADALLEKYATDERQNPADIRRGCFIVFITVFVLLAAGLVTVWLMFYR